LKRLLLVLAIMWAASSADAQDRPPRLLGVAALPRPAGEMRDGVEVQVLIEPDASAALDACEEEAWLCASIEAAIAHAQFEPAMREGIAVRARVRVRLELEPLPRMARAVPQEVATEPGLGVTAEVVRVEGGAREITLAEARNMPGAMGDPLRAVLVLPGVVPLLEYLPFFYLRGAPASGTIYYFDSIPLPAIFHTAPGASVVHPRMLGDMQIVSGVPSARYGRLSGGVVVGEGPPTPEGDSISELELRLTDVSAYVHARRGTAEVAMSARYGFPGVVARIFVNGIDMQYADYQLRARFSLDSDRRIEIVWLGSYDLLETSAYIGFEVVSEAATTLVFHRAELRYVFERANVEVGAAVRLGLDEGTTIGATENLHVDAVTGGARTWVTIRDPNVSFHAGGEHYGIGGEVRGRVVPHPILALVDGSYRRTISAVFGELQLRPWPWLRAELGLRGDVYVDPGEVHASVDPRARVIFQPDPAISVHAAFGLAHQQSMYILPLAALNELPTREGLQNVVQSEIGAAVRVREAELDLAIEARGYLHRFENMVVEDFVQREVGLFCDHVAVTCEELFGDYRLSYTTWGAELDVRAGLGPHFSVRASYTLAFLDPERYLGLIDYTPSQDVQHVANLVLAYDSRDGFTAGLRAFVRSGEPRGINVIDAGFRRIEYRLPPWGRLDAMIAYAWNAGWARLRVSLDWVNVLFALGGPPLDRTCADESCEAVSAPAFPLPSLGMRGVFE
jgi:hypothetical protein